ncbi:s-adenosyl-l-methionine-dependent methyltransferase [Lucifera butyrica]|uniref:S-adenosyl-l-methionine-dependent methyltransferase n=1 Tax=Lucifera butyrica TaxID=1351585 RepID=A0A498R5G4_9FIRM|nr:class I SAM-dependent methyltransferase [Lucifera butyrica]VBB06067.1 s-adenosyl-l-methionine-dependent methyltransferase [Lucifera butyrica]
MGPESKDPLGLSYDIIDIIDIIEQQDFFFAKRILLENCEGILLKISERLMAIASFVPPGAAVADIGTDHAYLPVYLIQQKIAPRLVAGDLHTGPFRAAQNIVKQHSLTDRISLRQGDGFTIISPYEVDVAVIAGMGGSTMLHILTARPEVVASLSHLILQPMIGAGEVRQWLAANGWKLTQETLVKEDGRLYEILVAEKGLMDPIEPVLYEVGPLLWRRRHPLLREHMELLLGQWEKVLTQMNGSKEAVLTVKYYELLNKIQQMEAYLKCL